MARQGYFAQPWLVTGHWQKEEEMREKEEEQK